MLDHLGRLIGAPQSKLRPLKDVHTEEISALGPRGAKARKWAARLVAFAASVSAIVLLIERWPVRWADVGLGLSAVVAAYVASLILFASLFRCRRTITFTDDAVTVSALLWDRAFDRNVPLSFALLSHDLAEMEAERVKRVQQGAHKNGRTARRQYFFAKSYHLVIEQLGERKDVMAIYGEKRALALRARLQARLDTHGKNIGVAVNPDKDWPAATGELPAA